MNLKYIFPVGLAILVLMGVPSAQTISSKQLDSNYVERCIQSQVKMHEKLKEISPEHFQSYCECTSKQLANNLNTSQLNDLNKSGSKPKRFKSAEEAASKACLKPSASTQV
jgi:hypothetical protein